MLVLFSSLFLTDDDISRVHNLQPLEAGDTTGKNHHKPFLFITPSIMPCGEKT